MTKQPKSNQFLEVSSSVGLRPVAFVRLVLCSCLFLLACFFSADAQVNFAGTYSQNFDVMGTSTTPPAGWTHIGSLGGSNSTWSSTIPASGSPSAASAGTTNNTLIVATNTFGGTSNSSAFNYSGSNTADRSLGTSPTSGAGNILQLRLLNATGAAVQTLTIAYNIRRFATASSAESIPGYLVFVSTNGGTSWSEIVSLRPGSTGVPNTNGTSTLNQTVTLPAAVANGSEIRLRWVDDNSANSSPDQRIGLDNVNISTSAPATCGTPSGLNTTSITQTAASLSWAAVAGASAYNLQWGPASNPAANTVSGLTATTFNLSGLTAGTGYAFQVQAVCGATAGAYAPARSFTTLAATACGIPAGLTATQITQTSATLNWTSVTGAVTYNLQWGPASNPAANTVTGINAVNFAISGLTASTAYAFQVQAVCATASSVYSSAVSFTTSAVPGACATPAGLNAGSITSTAATLNWTAVTGATSYNLQWGPTANPAANTVSNITTTSYNLGSLTASTAYAFSVQAVCSGVAGLYSASVSFTTLAGGTLNEVVYLWSGAIQPTSATVVAKMTSASTTCRALASTSQTLTNPVFSSVASASSTNNLMAKMNFTGLQPNTTYYYAIESNGVVDNSATDIGVFKTPAAGPFSFSFTVGSCSSTGNHQVYTAMQNKNPLFFLQTGDFHYRDPNSTNISTHRTPYESVILSQAPTANFLRNTALAYMWDDHDYCGNNNVGSNLAGTANARQAYQEYVPHYPLVAGSGNVPIYQAFTIGRVRFILADLRSLRSGSSMFGTTQKAWFKQECLNARDKCQVIAWVTGTSFGGTQSDNWGGFSAERTELCNFFRDNNILNMFIMSGDAHMLAVDNGTNHDFSTGSNNPNDYPVFAAAALNNSGSDKGGTYSQGKFTNPSSSNGQYGLVEVVDNGGSSITFNFKGYRTSGNTTTESVIVSYNFTRNICTPAARPTAQAPLSFTTRSLNDGSQVHLVWRIQDGKAPMKLERSGSDGRFSVLDKQISPAAEFTDNAPFSGWNEYRITNDRNEVVATRKIFVKGGSELKLSPNPAQSNVRLTLQGTDKVRSAYLLVFSSPAKNCVLEKYLDFTQGNSAHLNIQQLEPGLYTVMLQVNGATYTRPLLIHR